VIEANLAIRIDVKTKVELRDVCQILCRLIGCPITADDDVLGHGLSRSSKLTILAQSLRRRGIPGDQNTRAGGRRVVLDDAEQDAPVILASHEVRRCTT
jgi:hypothetical protein